MNTQSKHTPGPWEVVGSRICTVANDKERITLAKTKPGGAFAMSEQQEANATLLAAAPAMYQAGCLSLDVMERVAMALERMGNEGLRSIVRSAVIEQKAALAQAEGRG